MSRSQIEGEVRMKRYGWLLGVVILGLAGCQADKEGINEKAAIEGKATSEAGIKAENANLLSKSQEMESDLTTRHRFYQAVRGTFEGDLQTNQGSYKIRLTLVPSLHPYIAPRIRQLDEVVSDLNNLYFNAQVVQWNAANPLSAVGCRVSGIRPDLINGEITIAAESCPNLYSLRITDGILSSADLGAARLSEVSSRMAAQITEGKLDKIDSIAGEVHPSTNASVYHFVVARARSK